MPGELKVFSTRSNDFFRSSGKHSESMRWGISGKTLSTFPEYALARILLKDWRQLKIESNRIESFDAWKQEFGRDDIGARSLTPRWLHWPRQASGSSSSAENQRLAKVPLTSSAIATMLATGSAFPAKGQFTIRVGTAGFDYLQEETAPFAVL